MAEAFHEQKPPAAPNEQTWRRARYYAPFFVVMLAFWLVVAARHCLSDSDSYWHTVSGLWIWRHHAVPHVDPYSWRMTGQPWVAHAWLSEVLMAGAYSLGGWSGVVVLTAFSVTLSAFMLVLGLQRLGASLVPGVVLWLLGLMSMLPSLLARPHLLVLPVTIAWVVVLQDAARHRCAPPLAALVLMVLWVNMHGTFPLGLVMATCVAGDALINAWREDGKALAFPLFWGWLRFGLLAGLMCLITPYGLEGALFPFHLVRMHSLGLIVEWEPLDLKMVQPAEILLAWLLYFLLVRRLRIGWCRAGFVAYMAWSTFAHSRNQILFGLLTPLFLAPGFAKDTFWSTAASVLPPRALTRRWWKVLAASAVMVVGAALWVLPCVPKPAITPQAAFNAVDPALRAGRVFNDYDFGGYLLFNGVRPYIDGRADMYGDAVLEEYKGLLSASAAQIESFMDHYDVAWMLLHPRNPMVATLDKMPQWHRLFADTTAAVFVRAQPLEVRPRDTAIDSRDLP